MTLIAEDLLLLLLDDGSGKPVVDSTKLPRAVAGAVILELAMSGVVTVAQDGEDVKKGRLAVRGPRPDEPILQEAVAAIDGALTWFQANALQGMRLETVEAPEERFAHHRSTTDRRLVADPTAPPLWGRFHDLADNSVVLADREGNRLQDYSQVGRERRTGYHWYGTWPQALLQRDAPAWRARMATAEAPITLRRASGPLYGYHASMAGAVPAAAAPVSATGLDRHGAGFRRLIWF